MGGAAAAAVAVVNPVALIGTAVSGGYGIYAGERARKDAANQYRDAKDEAERQRVRQEAQMRADKDEMAALAAEEKRFQEETRTRLRGEQGASLAKVRGEIPGMKAKLGEDLLGQQEKAYARMAPQLEARLNALGLLQSGALPEAQAKYQGDLEAQRQAALADFGMSAEREVSIDRPLAYSSDDIGRQYNDMQTNLGTSRSNLAQRFANQNAAYENEVARSQYLSGLGAAKTSADQESANAYLNFAGQLGSGLIQSYGSRQQSQQKPNYALDALYKSRDSYNTAWQGPRRY